MKHVSQKELIAHLKNFISEKRAQRFDEVIAQRTDHIRVVLENIYQAHNASAVLRSCDCFGIQNVHFIENKNTMKLSDDVAMGSSNWLSIHRHKTENTTSTLQALKNEGYKIVATTPHAKSFTIDNLPIDNKLALVFGTEIEGISADVEAVADYFVKIPMYGFTESFNISVSAALFLYELNKRLRKSEINFLMDESQKEEIYFNWLKRSIEKSEGIIERYLKEE
jgi:tRNA (guanosine-2'-O-)-methyltransferase